jgi:hypothetical protein
MVGQILPNNNEKCYSNFSPQLFHLNTPFGKWQGLVWCHCDWKLLSRCTCKALKKHRFASSIYQYENESTFPQVCFSFSTLCRVADLQSHISLGNMHDHHESTHKLRVQWVLALPICLHSRKVDCLTYLALQWQLTALFSDPLREH